MTATDVTRNLIKRLRDFSRSRPSRQPCFEALEDRLCLTATIASGEVPWLLPRVGQSDTQDTIASAISIGAIGDDHSVSSSLTSSTSVKLYSFTVVANQKVAFDIDTSSSTLDSFLRVFDANGTELASNDSGSAANEGTAGADAFVEFTFPTAGTYYVGVSGSGNSGYNASTGTGDGTGTVGNNGSFTLNVALTGGGGFSQINGTATRSSDSATSSIFLQKFFNTSTAISTTSRTWLLIHGYMGNGKTSGLTAIANTIHSQFPSDQVITLDWSDAASDPTYSGAESWLQPVGQAAEGLLERHGLAGSNINIVGYSFGTYVGNELAKLTSGGVQTMAMIDPPIDGGSPYDPAQSVNFAAYSQFSWAFHDSNPTHTGHITTPTTADEAFVVNNTTHGAMIALFNSLISGSNGVSSRFQLSRLIGLTAGPWQPNQWTDQGVQTNVGGYEGVISTSGGGTTATGLTYVNPNNGLTVME